ncbi:MAG: hypothetical protein Kapaf2KO_08290 [Candidatus Kapaibacteriales bacterium]
MSKIWDIKGVLEWGVGYFERKGIEAPRTHIEQIVSAVTGFDRLQMYMKFDRPFEQDELDEIRGHCLKVAEGMPLQYVVGRVPFSGLDIFCEPSALIPRPETEEMVEKILLTYAKRDLVPNTVLDIGTGTGAIAIRIAKQYPNSLVYAVDISQDAIDLAKRNAAKNRVDNITFLKTDILSKTPSLKYDLIVSNPPYVSIADYKELDRNVRDYEPEIALTDGSNGLAFYGRFVTVFQDAVSKYIDSRFDAAKWKAGEASTSEAEFAENKGQGEMWLEYGEGQEKSIDSLFSEIAKVEHFIDFRGKSRFCRISYK